MGTDHKHRICTYEEAEEALRAHERIYVNDCFCRGPAKRGETNWKYCGHTIDNCMGFYEPSCDNLQYTYREITQKEALEKYEAWKNQGNLFRFMEDDQWICFCCSCGCDWFRDKEGNIIKDTCDKSPFIEKTDLDLCNLCGDCIDICAYDVRSINDDTMIVKPENCYGCSACVYVCEEDAITMEPRTE